MAGYIFVGRTDAPSRKGVNAKKKSISLNQHQHALIKNPHTQHNHDATLQHTAAILRLLTLTHQSTNTSATTPSPQFVNSSPTAPLVCLPSTIHPLPVATATKPALPVRNCTQNPTLPSHQCSHSTSVLLLFTHGHAIYKM